jgi:hypothetical protein
VESSSFGEAAAKFRAKHRARPHQLHEKGDHMNSHVSAILLGVNDIDRSKRF